LARECGVNANQVGRWLREQGHERRRRSIAPGIAPTPVAFVAVPVVARPAAPVEQSGSVPAMGLQASLPNGVAIDLRGIKPRHIGEVIGALGRLRCSVSTKA
jgi:transposase